MRARRFSALRLSSYSKCVEAGQRRTVTALSGRLRVERGVRSVVDEVLTMSEQQPVPRISRLRRTDVSESSGAIYDRYLRERGNVPNMFRTMAHRPEIFETIIAHMEAVLNTGTLPKALKELVIVRTSQLNRTPYCLASHTAICRKLGWTEEQLGALESKAASTTFTEREQVAIHLAEVMTLDAHGYTQEHFERLRGFYNEGEVVELMAAIGLFNYFNRFNDVLEMEPTRAATVEELVTAGV